MKTNEYFYRKKVNIDKLIKYGFVYDENHHIYSYHINILHNQFRLDININDQSDVYTSLWDIDMDEEYILYNVDTASGEFIGNIRKEVMKILMDISNNCFDDSIFKSEQTLAVIGYIKDKYHDDIEFLWKEYPDIGVIRNKINSKWYFLVTKLPKYKLDKSIKDKEYIVETINLTGKAEDIQTYIDNKSIYAAWHMNKKTWFTIILDNSVPTPRIYKLIDDSYQTSVVGKKK